MLGFLIPFDSMMSLFGKGGPATITVASIDGTDITLDEYQKNLQQRKSILSYGSDEALENAVWNDMIENHVLADDYEALGLYIGKEEYDEIRFGQKTSNFVNSVFYGGNPTDEAKQNLQETFSTWYNGTMADRQMWESYKEIITSKRKREKYDKMVSAGAYMNTLDAKMDDLSKNEKVSFDYVVKKYASIPDSVITFSESDVKSYFEKHKNDEEYKQKTARSIEYVSFDISPSSADSTEIIEGLEAKKTEFASSTNDSLFVITQSDNGVFNKVKYREGDIAGEVDSLIFNAEINEVVGPYFDKNTWKLSKVMDKGQVPEVQARHILLKTAQDGSDGDYLREKADSLKTAIKRGGDFEELAKEFSEDPGSAVKGGDLGWFGKGKMVPPFEEACFNGKIGDMPIVQSQFGIHLIEITDRREIDELTLANVQRSVRPSPSTLDKSYKAANEWVINNSSSEETFRAAGDSLGMKEAKSILPNARNIPGVNNSLSVVDWTYKAEIGEISSPLLTGNKYIVAILNNITEEGIPNFEAVKDEMEEKVKKEKKADYYFEIMSQGKNLDEVSTAVNERVLSAKDVSLSSNSIPNGGSNELEVIGTAMFLNEGEMSYPIKGNGGIYVIATTSKKTDVELKDDYSSDAANLTSRVQGRAAGGRGIFSALKNAADIEDKRREF